MKPACALGVRLLEVSKGLPGKPVAYSLGLFCLNKWLLWGAVAHYYMPPGFPGMLEWQIAAQSPAHVCLSLGRVVPDWRVGAVKVWYFKVLLI